MIAGLLKPRLKQRCKWLWITTADWTTKAIRSVISLLMLATVAVAYHRAAAVYVEDEEMQELGTAAVHLLTMATSYMIAQKE